MRDKEEIMENDEKSVKLLMQQRTDSIALSLKKSEKNVFQSCTSSFLGRFHIAKWITKYNSSFFFADLIAGITIGKDQLEALFMWRGINAMKVENRDAL